jgi:predicted DNA-binding ribbon-helix-helix protein
VAKKQTRRSISLKAQSYARLEDLANAVGLPVSALVEDIVAAVCESNGIAEVSREDGLLRLKNRNRKNTHPECAADFHSGIFTF